MERAMLFAAGLCVFTVGTCKAQENKASSQSFDRRNTWTVFAEYSNNSTPIIAGIARQRKLATLGAAYTRRVVRFGGTALGYQIELRPVVFESDPVQINTSTLSTPSVPGSAVSTFTSSAATVQACRPGSSSFTEPTQPPYPPVQINTVSTCGHQWTFGQSFSPLGFKYTVGIHRSVQPFLIGTLGYMYTSRPVPLANAESFNFIIDVGAGIEIYRKAARSVAVEARVHHFSNRDTAEANPGTDNLVYRISYSFGR